MPVWHDPSAGKNTAWDRLEGDIRMALSISPICSSDFEFSMNLWTNCLSDWPQTLANIHFESPWAWLTFGYVPHDYYHFLVLIGQAVSVPFWGNCSVDWHQTWWGCSLWIPAGMISLVTPCWGMHSFLVIDWLSMDEQLQHAESIFLENCLNIWIKMHLIQFQILIISLVIVSLELKEFLTIDMQSCPY